MPKGAPILESELGFILERFDHYRKVEGLGLMQAYEAVGSETGRSTKVIGVIINRQRPTVNAARTYLRSKALRMARKIVKRGSTADLINILERPGIGVLDPLKRQDSGGGGFFLSVSVDSCGAVKMGAAVGQAQLPAAPVEVIDSFAIQPGDSIAISEEEVSSGPIRGGAGQGRTAQVIQSAREKLAKARQLERGGGPGGRAEDSGLQVSNE